MINILKTCGLLLSALMTALTAQAAVLSGNPASDDFIKASLLIASPGAIFYQAYGHTAIRMECPSAGLDYVFTFQTGLTGDDIGQLLVMSDGHTQAVFVDDYLAEFIEEGREVESYTLNLTPRERQELWRVLDRANVTAEKGFNLREKNCMTEAFKAINMAVAPRHVDIDGSDITDDRYGAIMNTFISPSMPWSAQLLTASLGTCADAPVGPVTMRMPIVVKAEAGKYVIADYEGNRRPLFKGEPEVLAPQTAPVKPVRPTPMETALIFAALTLAVCAADLAGRLRRVTAVFDALLLAAVTLLGCVVLTVTYMPARFGGPWNWNLLVFNPLPLLIWLGWHRRPRFGRVYAVYAAVLGLTAVAGPLLTLNITAPVAVVAAAMAARCAVKFYKATR